MLTRNAVSAIAFPTLSIQLLARSVLRLLPKFIRTFFYRRLFSIGKSRYPQELSTVVHRLPLGLYAKTCGRGRTPRDNEPKALQLLEREAPSVPAPRFIDTFQATAADGGEEWFIMTSLSGDRVMDVLYRMSYPELDQLAEDLRSVLGRMRKIQNKTPYLIGNVSGGRIHDHRASAPGGCGPYNSEADFNAHLSKGVEDYLRKFLPNAFSKTHKSVFTHSDLFLGNVLVERGRLSGIVDWESAGFMPEYWEFTRAMWSSKNNKDVHALYRRIWGNEFDEELEVEQRLWLAFPFSGPEADDCESYR